MGTCFKRQNVRKFAAPELAGKQEQNNMKIVGLDKYICTP